MPAHTQYMKDKYGLGLGINSMEGREAKHVFVARYTARILILFPDGCKFFNMNLCP